MEMMTTWFSHNFRITEYNFFVLFEVQGLTFKTICEWLIIKTYFYIRKHFIDLKVKHEATFI